LNWRKQLGGIATTLLLLGSLQAQSAKAPLPALNPPIPGYNFPVHETLSYAVDWRVFPAGTAVFHLQQDGPLERVTATSETIGAVNLIYKVVDRFESSFNRTTGCSQSFSRQISEGHRRVDSNLTFDYGNHKSIFQQKNLVNGTTEHKQATIPSCVSDDLSSIFYPASQNLIVGQDFGIPLADVAKTVAVTMKVEDHETVKTPLGTFQTIRVQPTADAGVVKNRGNIWIWYTDDARHIPVQMRARLFWGTITFRLTSISDK
jgi:hypothetical protein